MPNERLEKAIGRLTPEMRERIAGKIGKGTLPPVLFNAIPEGAVDSLVSGEVPHEAGVSAPFLEAIVQRTGRPPLLISNDKVEFDEDDLADFVTGTDKLVTGLNSWIPSVGRVEFLNHDMSWGGTAWVVEKKGNKYLMVTNRHVAALVAKRAANGSVVFMRSTAGARYGMNVDFAEPFGPWSRISLFGRPSCTNVRRIR